MNDLASEVMTVDEMAAYLRLHPLTVRAMARKGDLCRCSRWAGSGGPNAINWMRGSSAGAWRIFAG